MEDVEIIDLINEATTKFNGDFDPEQYPDVRIGDFMTITREGNRITQKKRYGESSGTQDLDNGLIDENTTTLETEDVNISAKEAPYIDWGKSVIYTNLGVERAKALDINLDTEKLETLRGVAFRTIQKVALKGHEKRTDVTGMLNNPSVEIFNLTKGKPLSEMNGKEVRAWFINLFKSGYRHSGGIVMPNTVAIHDDDYLTLSGSYDKDITNGNGTINVLKAIKDAISDFIGQEAKILPIPQGFAENAGIDQSARAVVYTNTKEVIYQDWALAPTAGEATRRGSLAFEVAMQAQYTGAVIRKLDRILYVDYKSSK